MNKFATQKLKLGTSQSSFHPASQVADEEKNDVENENILRRQQSFEDAMHLSVKDHIDKLENALADLKDELKQSRKDLNFIREELTRLKQENMQTDHGVTQYVCDEVHNSQMSKINRLQADLRKNGRSDLNQMDSFTMQIVQLRLDKEELDENTRITDFRTCNCEQDVGFRRVYD